VIASSALCRRIGNGRMPLERVRVGSTIRCGAEARRTHVDEEPHRGWNRS
jgi:hypothetical protein